MMSILILKQILIFSISSRFNWSLIQRANVIHQLALELRKDGVDINDVDEKYASDHFPYLR